MQHTRTSAPGRSARRLILGGAFALGLALALAPHTGDVQAADAALVVVQADSARDAAAGKAAKDTKATKTTDAKPGADAKAGANAKAGVDAESAAAAAPAPGAAAPDAADADAENDEAATSKRNVTIDRHGIVIEKGNKRVRVEGLGRDREYDSFEQFVQDAPWLAGLVFLTVLLVFLVPLLIIVLLIWYKMRKNRLANETMLKLAERGVVPPATAMDAVASGNAAAVAAAAAPSPAPAGMPAYEHARLLHRRTVWSDLRKGVILTGVGLGLSAWSMFDDGSPNGPGLIFLFVGLGYCLLWFFEDRTNEPRRDPSVTPPSGGA
jgi:uncharacterized protein DUF6249